MFTFTPLPVASAAGLAAAFGALDEFLPDPMVVNAQRLDALLGRRRRSSAADLRDQLQSQGELDAAGLVTAAWESWRGQRGGVERAVSAERERTLWAARRQVADSPEARRQLRAWAQQAAELVPPAVTVAAATADTINGAAQGVTHTEDPIRRVVPSWR